MSVTLHLGDCLEVMRGMADGIADAVICDPPYGVNLAKWDSDIPPQEILDECLRVSSGAVVWFGGAKTVLDFARYVPRPDRMLIWHVTFSLGAVQQNGIYYKWHPIWCWRLPKMQHGIQRDFIKEWESATAQNNGYDHPAKKPEKIMRLLVESFGGNTVLDPFMGSGTTGVACTQTGRNFIGIEIDPAYYEMANRRIEQAQMQMPLLEVV